MPRNLVRYQQTGSDLHFITFSCYRRQAYLGTAEACDLFEKSLETMRLRYGFWITGYVIMPEHVHLLVGEPPVVLLSKVLQVLKLSVAVQKYLYRPKYIKSPYRRNGDDHDTKCASPWQASVPILTCRNRR